MEVEELPEYTVTEECGVVPRHLREKFNLMRKWDQSRVFGMSVIMLLKFCLAEVGVKKNLQNALGC